MSTTRIIKRNKELEVYFLRYIRTAYYQTLLGEVDETDIDDILKQERVLENFKDALNELADILEQKYNLVIDYNTHDCIANKIIIEVSEYYVQKYSIHKILEMTEKYYEFQEANKQENLMNEILNISITECSKCGKRRDKVRESKIPPEMLNQIIEEKIEVDYYLHCPNCNEYSMIIKE
ncbi:hypothetical protein [Carboxylicivirga linearis]|uniref:Uncharacterized protein n=1 Tax=Carboxylicivirga linearis TaxID=1628157 RepID=A0ABS5K1V6_9BACT|nr:hypothetical protein [Carboxylicivirga linearis]MBS2101148.1 hypothetical protein [Carboxylicivirga linearis]